jgi:putative ABC transport system permease protein
MRALLTMLGIIIGIGSVIGIVTVGDSLSASVSSNMQSLGATNILLSLTEKNPDTGAQAGVVIGGVVNYGPSESDMITDEMLDQFSAFYAGEVGAVAVTAGGGSGKAQDGRLYANISEIGVNAGYQTANNINIISGRFLRDEDIRARRSVAVVSDKFVNNMFPKDKDSALGKEIKLSMRGDDIHSFTIVGVYQYEQQALMMSFAPTAEIDMRTEVYIPISTEKMLTSAYQGYDSATVMASTGVDAVSFAGDIKEFFNKNYYANNSRWEVDTMSMETIMSTVTNMLGTVSIAVSVIAGISLVVGGIGVMNIMLVSVTERTREIGTRKALGARNSAIRVQFIVEAVIICAIGGLLGIVTGFLLGFVGSSLLGFPAAPSLTIIIIAVLFSMLIGVFFGYYPANKASRLDPIEALRYE